MVPSDISETRRPLFPRSRYFMGTCLSDLIGIRFSIPAKGLLIQNLDGPADCLPPTRPVRLPGDPSREVPDAGNTASLFFTTRVRRSSLNCTCTNSQQCSNRNGCSGRGGLYEKYREAWHLMKAEPCERYLDSSQALGHLLPRKM